MTQHFSITCDKCDTTEHLETEPYEKDPAAAVLDTINDAGWTVWLDEGQAECPACLEAEAAWYGARKVKK